LATFLPLSRALAPDTPFKIPAVSKRDHHPPDAKNGNSAEYGSYIG
jgi:hypothetical protein